MNYIWIIIIVLDIVAAHFIASYIGTKRKIGYGNSFLVAFLFGPIIGLIVTSSSGKIENH